MTTPTVDKPSILATLTRGGHPATLTGLRVAVGLPDKPATWAAAVTLDAVAAWMAAAADGIEEEQTGADPSAVTLAAVPPVGTLAPPAAGLSHIHGLTHADAAARLTAAGLGDGLLTGNKTGAAVAAGRAVVGAVLAGAVQAAPVVKGDGPEDAAPVTLSGGWPGHVPAGFACRVVVPVSTVRAALSLGYDVRPHVVETDARGKDRRKPCKPTTWAVRQPATDKTPARAVYVSGYALEDVVTAATAARVKRDLRARPWAGVDVAAIIDADGLDAAAAAVAAVLSAAAAVEAAASNAATGAAVEAARVEAGADAAAADKDAADKLTRRAARGYAGKMERIHKAAVVVNRGRAAALTAA